MLHLYNVWIKAEEEKILQILLPHSNEKMPKKIEEWRGDRKASSLAREDSSSVSLFVLRIPINRVTLGPILGAKVLNAFKHFWAYQCIPLH